MTEGELIEMARARLKDFKEHDVGGFDKSRIREAAIITFGSEQRRDYVDIVVDRYTGEFIRGTYYPRKTSN